MGNSKKMQVISDQGFDDDELEDIMSEIQGLEKEFVQLKEATKKDVKPSSKDKTDKTVLQHAMEKEVKESLKKTNNRKKDNLFDSNELNELQKDLDQMEAVKPSVDSKPKKEPIKKEPVKKEKIVPFANVKQATGHIKKKDEPMKAMNSVQENYSSNEEESGVMNFSGMGRMNRFELDFAVGKGNAKVVVNDGIAVHVAGIEILINESEGCQISAPGGVRLNVPIE